MVITLVTLIATVSGNNWSIIDLLVGPVDTVCAHANVLQEGCILRVFSSDFLFAENEEKQNQ